LKALLNEYSLGNIAANVELRKELYEIAKKENGKLTLHNLLHQVDPQTASRLHVNDIRRVIRAIEVFKTTGVSISSQTQTTNNKYNLLLLGLYEDRSFLYKKIEDRVEIMFDRGLVDEVKWLIKYGVNTNAQSLKGIGYKEILPYLYGEHDLDTTKYNIKINTRRYAKRQITFFKSFDNIDWINKNEENCYFNSANEKIIKWMQTND
ncbi:MAG: tRNA (adenosine(37)-N6)-dimethylallyltransferase MiaA, partial [Christensenellaceae bacterium]|nr:tRNA (adenosine(37)-N6)-dimethylallyltransferase MiaA [Christensenellaceae bacterium]